MKERQRVVWFEGMTLDPHHFQQWDRYQTGVLNARFATLSPHNWGLTELEVDRDRLVNGEVALVRATGVMPDGQFVEFPATDPVPAARNLQEHFPASQERIGVYLTLPSERRNGSNFTLGRDPHQRETRYVAETAVVMDENTGVDERQIEVARGNFRLRFSTEALEPYTAMKVAEVVRGAGGVFALDDRFVPPCLNIRASEGLRAIVRRLVERLVAKSKDLGERREGARAQRELTPGDVTAMQQLSVVNAYIPLLNHYHRGAGAHPERLYLTLAGLAGELSSCVGEVPVHPRDFPAYQHDAPAESFSALDRIIGQMLGDAAPPSNYVRLSVDRIREHLYATEIEERLLEVAQLYLVVSSERYDERQLIDELPRMLRAASPSTIDAVLRSYTRALPVEHTHRLPSGMPVDQQAVYFQLQKRGPFWEAICADGALALFVPQEFSDITFRLIAVELPA